MTGRTQKESGGDAALETKINCLGVHSILGDPQPNILRKTWRVYTVVHATTPLTSPHVRH